MISSSFFEMRKRNSLRIIEAIREQPGLSRAELARASELAKSTVSSVVDELVKMKLLIETGAKSSSQGRRPVGLSFNPSSRVIIGISIDQDRLQIAVSNLDGILIGIRARKIGRIQNTNKIVAVLLIELQKLLARQNIGITQICGVGLALPAPLGLDSERLRDQLSTELNCPIFVDSNTNMAAFGESRLGGAGNIQEALVVRLGYEVRSALIIDNKLFKGAEGRAGEFGHITVPGGAAICSCGKKGCINASASIEAIIQRVRKSGLSVENIDDVIQLALSGEIHCKEALSQAGKSVGYGIASCVNLLAPSYVIITGHLNAAASLVFDPLQETFAKFSTAGNFSITKLVIGGSQEHIEAVGASLAVLLRENFMMNVVSNMRN